MSLLDIAYSIFRAKDEKRQITEELSRHRFMDAKSDYRNVRAPRTDKHGGYIAHDGVVVAQTVQCGHCPAHWVYRPGSKEIRGFCMGCKRHTCGHPDCDAHGPNGCLTWEQKMEIIEKRGKKLIVF